MTQTVHITNCGRTHMSIVFTKFFTHSFSVKKFIFTTFVLLLSAIVMAQTYTTAAAGNWTSPSTWVGGTIPSYNITSGMVVNIKHRVNCDLTNDIIIAGKLNVVGDTLFFPATFTKKTTVTSTGQ